MSTMLKILKIKRDDDPLNPRKDGEPLTTMACRHSRYELGDEQIGRHTSLSEYRREVIPETALVRPVYLYDHSGLTIATTPFSCPWDSGQLGWVWIDRQTMVGTWGNLVVRDKHSPTGVDESPMREAALKCIEADVAVYDQYLMGDVWGFQLVERSACHACGSLSENELDSCWGFYGDDPHTNGMADHLDMTTVDSIEKE